MRYLVFLGLWFTGLSFVGCNGHRFDIEEMEDLPSECLAYDSLPESVRLIYASELTNFDRRKDYREVFVSTRIRDSVSYKHYTIANLPELIMHGFIYEFYINGNIYSLEANKMDPFIFDEKYFYYSNDFGLDKTNYRSAKYMQVKLF